MSAATCTSSSTLASTWSATSPATCSRCAPSPTAPRRPSRGRCGSPGCTSRSTGCRMVTTRRRSWSRCSACSATSARRSRTGAECMRRSTTSSPRCARIRHPCPTTRCGRPPSCSPGSARRTSPSSATRSTASSGTATTTTCAPSRAPASGCCVPPRRSRSPRADSRPRCRPRRARRRYWSWPRPTPGPPCTGRRTSTTSGSRPSTRGARSSGSVGSWGCWPARRTPSR